MVHEPRPHRVRPVDPLPSGSRVPPLRKPLRRGSQMAQLLRLGSVPIDGFRPADLPRKPPRYRSVPAFAFRQALPHGIRCPVARSTLADANESRDWRIYADFAQVLIRIARPLYARDPIGVDLDQTLYALDSTTIDLCLSLFPWAKFRRHKAAVKMHTLLDLPRQHPHVYPHYRRQNARRQHPRRDRPRARRLLRHGSGLRRFRTPLRVHPLLVVLRRANQEEHLAPTALLASRRQVHGRALGSDRHPGRHRIGPSVSGPVAAGPATSTPRRTSGCSS